MPVPAGLALPVRSLLRDDVYLAIRDAIVRGEIRPGEKLVDSELQRWLGVSRTPIREALLRLERIGLVTAIPGRATLATPYDAEAVAESRAVAAELHALATRLAVPVMTESDVARLRESNQRLHAGLAAQDPERCVVADDNFHAVFTERSRNSVLAAQLEQVLPVLRRAEYLHFNSSRALASTGQHELIIDAAAAGDSFTCAELVRQNWLALDTVG